MNYIYLDPSSHVPKSKQIVQSIQNAISRKIIKPGDQIPSYNEMMRELNVSRETVYRAYNELKYLGIILSRPGKGYYVKQSDAINSLNVFLMLDNYSTYKEIMFKSLEKNLGQNTHIDLYFHHFNVNLYKALIQDAIGKYTDYIILPLIDKKNCNWLQDVLSHERAKILDVGIELYADFFPCVCQNYSKAIYSALESASDLLEKYNTLIFSSLETQDNYQGYIKTKVTAGIKKYCIDYHFEFKQIKQIADRKISEKECYLTGSDFDLVELVMKARENSFRLGREVGCISFHESPLKEIIADGITTLSTDWDLMGKNMAEQILSQKNECIENPWIFVRRDSL